jgi:hypothetical protein
VTLRDLASLLLLFPVLAASPAVHTYSLPTHWLCSSRLRLS